jgi:hypothetical protein
MLIHLLLIRVKFWGAQFDCTLKRLSHLLGLLPFTERQRIPVGLASLCWITVINHE